MEISIWYVYLDSGKWLSDPVSGTDSVKITDAHEFHCESDAENATTRHEGIVLGWCQ